ncbi:zincin-like metallopeptidase domain-containing protein [Leeuwenhoekiella polynyae]|uniref:Antirestriction protein ArdC n=1 Tax=Leeuwenhoekiella polynyae TaxID=1550906 RepID=A0A4Q0PFV4_9FLAO|nr:zincin-like metallopeptidase domain-containing protein [Leeuwenhoekiella polynyae]RXG25711.1 antirestriction protein ArdC [Leeuwenhoekiella polynyae]
MNVVKEINGLNGSQVSRADLHKIYVNAKKQDQPALAQRIEKILNAYDDPYFDINIGAPVIEEIPNYITDNLPFEENPDEDYTGLNKAVSPDEIYQYITDLVINTIKEVGHLPWQREWEKTSLFNGWQAINYDSKKGYRGINFVLTNFEVKITAEGPALFPRDLSNPYFLTFNQIEKHGGKLKKGSKGVRVVYFTKLYSHTEKDPNTGDIILEFGTYNQKKFIAWLKKNRSKIRSITNDKEFDKLANSYIPILKYYNVFAGADVEGIEWGDLPKNENVDKPERERIEIAEAIVKAMPKPPKFIFGGDQPAYSPGSDHIRMTPIEAFKSEQSYYSTLFHEMIHSTGHRSRLDRFNIFDGKKEYAFEELIAELGAVFLCAESGILFETLQNSAKYLRGWNSRLVKSLEEDNRFFFRAASKSQAGSDYILDRDKDGQPAYLKGLVIEPVKAPEKTKTKKKPKPKPKPQKESKPVKQLNTRNPLVVEYEKQNPKVVNRVIYSSLTEAEKLKYVQNRIKPDPEPAPDPKPKKKPAKKSKAEEQNEKAKPGEQLALLGEKLEAKKTTGLPGGFVIASEGPAKKIDTFRLPGEIGKLLGDLQAYQLAILLTGDPHAGKTEFVTQLTDAFLDYGFKGAYLDLEQGGLVSKDTQNAFNRNIKASNQSKLAVTGEAPQGIDTVHAIADKFNFVVIDSFQELNAPINGFNDLRKQHPNTIFIVIFQQNGKGGTRGGIKGDYDAPVRLKVYRVDETFVNNYAQVEKNRGNKIGLQYNVSQKKVISDETPEPEVEAEKTPVQSPAVEGDLIIYE